MSKQEKIIFFVYCIVALIGIVFAVVDYCGWWEHADLFWMLTVALVLVVECAQNWKKNRKLAILEIIGGIIMLVCGIGEKLL